ncbi:MAG: glutamate--tRNA ligase [Deltaproteobacteria bacterium]|nr:glutamate--tRNA ligase [Deltaproteobacteria bacterium]
MTVDNNIRTRFAPSPTGYLHIGGARTALFNWLYARHNNGAFILRIEDTDKERSTAASTQAILDSMRWLGLDWDEGPFFQSVRGEIYSAYLEKLLATKQAYYCECTPAQLEAKRQEALTQGRKPKYDGTCREKGLVAGAGRVVRFRCPDFGETVVHDILKGNVAFRNEELDDLVVFRSDGFPTYNFAVVVDDAEMRITHIIRGDDHLNNTPRQILLYNALGLPLPVFCHVPMILGADKARLSKRHGATSVMAYQEMGYLPQAVVNYLVRLGWSHQDQEIFSLAELISFFGLGSLGKSAAVFNEEKLLWLNQHYIKTGTVEEIALLLKPFLAQVGINDPADGFLQQVTADLLTRSKTLIDMAQAGMFYFADKVAYDEEAANKFLLPSVGAILAQFAQCLAELQDYSKAGIEQLLRNFAADTGIKLKDIAQPLRVVLTGKTVSPGIDEVMVSLGREKTLQRLRDGVEFVGAKPPQGS